MKRIVILGGGTAGTIAANRLRRAYDARDAEIVVVDRDDAHVYQPGLLFVPFGRADPGRIIRPRHRQLHSGVSFRQAGIDHVEITADQVRLDDQTVLGYDVLVIASGARLTPEETEGLTGAGWMKDVFTFYTPAGAAALRGALERFAGGRSTGTVTGREGGDAPRLVSYDDREVPFDLAVVVPLHGGAA